MSRFLFYFLFTCAVALSAKAQSCSAPTNEINSQAELNAFFFNRPNCTTIDNSITIKGASIVNLHAMANITRINGRLRIKSTSLTDLIGLNNIEYIGTIDIEDNNDLQSLDGLNSLTEVGNFLGGFDLIINPSLVDFTALNNLTRIEGSFNVNSIGTSSFAGLENLAYIGGDFDIVGVDNIEDLTGFIGLTYVGRDLLMFGNDNLKTLNGLNNLTHMGARFSFNGNPLLSDFTPLSNLKGDIWYLDILFHDSLKSLDGLKGITSVDYRIRFHGNPLLEDISFISYLDLTKTDDLRIAENPLLEVCNYSNVCAYISNGQQTDIHDNALGCNSATEISNLCAQCEIAMFTATTGFWNNPASWSGNILPRQISDVVIPNSSTCNLQSNALTPIKTLCVEEGANLNLDSNSEIITLGN